ncbi:U3 small nucleolar ribonucleoprotein protein MPP10 isoform X1 [Hydra vulgaris]|uniref:U3 small nucleolar ribonucleoprotein protein MPP10 isoform X1 n=1 Tax=Hydra vulgaris TaxID=6087 RepID=UPI000640BBF5|nr:U3 small nucleolar ribonucleoprotein protein MPP10 [Hydra vulgaris]
MVTEAPCDTLESSYQIFNKLTSEPDIFLTPQINLCSDFIKLSKELYDYMNSFNASTTNNNSLKELLVDGFDNEQIWQQIQICNNYSINQNRKAINQLNEISKLNSSKNFITIKKTKNKSNNDSETEVNSNSEDVESEELEPESSENEDKDDFSNPKKVYKSTVVDDDFFKMGEMEEFLDAQDQIEEQLNAGQIKSNSENDIDLFNELSDNEDFEKREKEAKYDDFFGPSNKKKKKEVMFKDLNDDDVSEDELGEENEQFDEFENDENNTSSDEKNNKNEEPKSSFELNQNTITEKIKRLEESNLKKKEWQLQGEASAKQRPINSLLEEHVTFDHTSVGAPVITEETTECLEDVIKQRIKDEAWDDVKRKVKPVVQPFEYKKAPELNQEKSKISLAEVYEKEYLKQAEENEEEKENEEHVAIKNMMDKLFSQLDALSNFHFTPKPPIPEIKIITNVPSLRMEEVTPITMSEASQLAPEEIFDKKTRDIKGEGEKSETDRKHERRQKKIKKKFAVKEKERKEKLKVQSGKIDKSSSKKAAVAQLKKGVRNTIVNEKNSDKSIKSSSDFFNRLQTEVKDDLSKFKRKPNTTQSKLKKRVQFLKL